MMAVGDDVARKSQRDRATWPLHSTKYILDESVLHLGVAMHVGYAEAFIAEGFPTA